MDRPGGGLFFVPEFDRPNGLDESGALELSGPSPFADFSSRDSMIDLCWSRTEILRCNCSLIVGSWV